MRFKCLLRRSASKEFKTLRIRVQRAVPLLAPSHGQSAASALSCAQTESTRWGHYYPLAVHLPWDSDFPNCRWAVSRERRFRVTASSFAGPSIKAGRSVGEAMHVTLRDTEGDCGGSEAEESNRWNALCGSRSVQDSAPSRCQQIDGVLALGPNTASLKGRRDVHAYNALIQHAINTHK